MNQLGVVVPFAVFTEYRNRRLPGGDIAPASAATPLRRGKPDEEAGEETTVPAEPTTERILS